MSSSPEHMIASELVRLTDGQPTKLAVASFGIGIALGLSPRLRRVLFRSFVA
jgi:hypothetical protein